MLGKDWLDEARANQTPLDRASEMQQDFAPVEPIGDNPAAGPLPRGRNQRRTAYTGQYPGRGMRRTISSKLHFPGDP